MLTATAGSAKKEMANTEKQEATIFPETVLFGNGFSQRTLKRSNMLFPLGAKL